MDQLTIKEVLQEITKEPKWYIPHYKQQTASKIIKSINSGTAKLATIKKLFEFYGYSGDLNSFVRKAG